MVVNSKEEEVEVDEDIYEKGREEPLHLAVEGLNRR